MLEWQTGDPGGFQIQTIHANLSIAVPTGSNRVITETGNESSNLSEAANHLWSRSLVEERQESA